MEDFPPDQVAQTRAVAAHLLELIHNVESKVERNCQVLREHGQVLENAEGVRQLLHAAGADSGPVPVFRPAADPPRPPGRKRPPWLRVINGGAAGVVPVLWFTGRRAVAAAGALALAGTVATVGAGMAVHPPQAQARESLPHYRAHPQTSPVPVPVAAVPLPERHRHCHRDDDDPVVRLLSATDPRCRADTPKPAARPSPSGSPSPSPTVPVPVPSPSPSPTLPVPLPTPGHGHHGQGCLLPPCGGQFTVRL